MDAILSEDSEIPLMHGSGHPVSQIQEYHAQFDALAMNYGFLFEANCC
jgi:hypothetical protein